MVMTRCHQGSLPRQNVQWHGVAGYRKADIPIYRCGGSAGMEPPIGELAPTSRFRHARRGVLTCDGLSLYHSSTGIMSTCLPIGSDMPSDFVLAALHAAEAAGRIIRDAYRSDFTVRYKEDASPVTEIDVAAERIITNLLRARFPDHGFYGEELGRKQTGADYLWLIDPIDGTKAFVRGYPLFSVQIALMHQGQLIAGISHAPCWYAENPDGETMWAEKGGGAWQLTASGSVGSIRLQVSDTRSLDRATLSTGNLAGLARSNAWPRFGELIPKLHRIRGYGDFLHYHWLASGRLDAVIESDVNILDIAALSLIVNEAGGLMTDLKGRPVDLETTTVLAAVRPLHATLQSKLRYDAQESNGGG